MLPRIYILLLLITCPYAFKLYAQKFYANTPDAINEITVTSSGCQVRKLQNSCGSEYFSIALSGDTMYYYITSTATLYRTFLSQPSRCEKVDAFDQINALTVDKNGILYTAFANTLVILNPYTLERKYFSMPFISAGDLMFYNDKLYMAADPNIIAEINLDSPMLSKEYFRLPQSNVFGLTSIAGSCAANKVFALAAGDTGTELVELDMENKKSLGVKCSFAEQYYDAASITENGLVKGITIDSLQKRNICIGSSDPSFLKVVVSGFSGNLTYTLNNSINNTTGVFENLEAGLYKIHIAANDSCYTDTSVVIEKGFCNVYVPTAFTPNHDGRNDVFRPLGLTPTGSVALSIYNRWGKKIYETKNFSQGWDGTVNGINQPPGTYVWTLLYNNEDNKPTFIKGTVVLLR